MDIIDYHKLPEPQRQAFYDLCQRYGEENLGRVIRGLAHEPFDLPKGYISGCVKNLYFGISPEGRIST